MVLEQTADRRVGFRWRACLPRSGRGYKRAADIVGAEILRLWRLAAEAVAAGFPSELPDGSRRTESRYFPVRDFPTTPRPSTRVKKAAA